MKMYHILVLLLAGLLRIDAAPIGTSSSSSCSPENSHIGDDSDCTVYWHCAYGVWNKKVTAPGTWWDAELNSLNYIDVVKAKNPKCAQQSDPTSPCSSSPCLNGGACTSSGSTYTCQCVGTYTGDRCQTAGGTIEACSSSPCLNGGACTSSGSTYTCQCVGTYTGDRCQTAGSNGGTIEGTSCSNEGAKIEYPNRCQSYYICVSGKWEGYNCPIINGQQFYFNPTKADTTTEFCDLISNVNCGGENPDACVPNPCLNTGVCHNSGSGFVCECVGAFSGTRCEVDTTQCSAYTMKPNAMDCKKFDFCYGSTWRTFDCDPGKYFSQNVGRCVDFECSSQPCQNSGICVDSCDGYACSCPNGYSGVNCEIKTTRECSPNPCKNGGVCFEESSGGFACSCPDGYTGPLCENYTPHTTLSPTPCASRPCQNGGTCMDREHEYICICKTGYAGVNCESTPCDPSPCLNGGLCVDIEDGTFACSCTSGFEGVRCESDINECGKTDDCDVNAFCTNSVGSFICTCNNGFTGDGKSCTKNSHCNSNPCINGQCYDNDEKYVCFCNAGYTGTNCETDLNECQSNPCGSTASCENTMGSYVCTCLPGYSGSPCQDINECGTTDNCNVNAHCTNTVGSYNCNCKAGYTGDGRTCTKVSPCDSNPCVNGGVCYDNADKYSCVCNGGYTGVNCEIAPRPCDPNPCQNDGTCTPNGSDYNCTCANVQFAGKNCDCAWPCAPNKIFFYPNLIDETKYVACVFGELNEGTCSSGQKWNNMQVACE